MAVVLLVGATVVSVRLGGAQAARGWEESWELSIPASSVCLPGGSHPATLRRGKGGTELRLEAAGAVFRAQIEGERVSGDGWAPATASCPGGRVSLVGRLAAAPGGGEALVGLLRPTLCAECRPTPFHALRR